MVVRGLRRIARTCLLPFAITAATAVAACHEAGDVRVTSLSFSGVHAFSQGQLRQVLATQTSGWLPWSVKHYFDREEFESDLKRVVAYYADRGFPEARIAGVDVAFNKAKDGVRLTIHVEEGRPVTVEAVRFEGFEDLPPDERKLLASVPLKAGGRRDRDAVRATRDQAVKIFRNNAYPTAGVDVTERPGGSPDRVIVSYIASPGPAMTFGPITTTGYEKLHESVIRREVLFKSGQPYDERLVLKTQRRLSALELLELAAVTPRLDQPEGTTVPVRITVSEGKPRRLRLGVGYGSEEQARGTLSWQHLNFMGGARRLTADAKWSSIDRGVRLGVTTPYFVRPGVSLTLATGVWQTNQLTYDSNTWGGRAMLSYHFDRMTRPSREPAHYHFDLTYGNDFLRYGIKPQFLDDQSRRDERIALGLDPETGRARGTLATMAMDFERSAVDVPLNPRVGVVTLAHAEYASPKLGGTYSYAELGGEVRGFVPLGPSVLAGRVRASTLISAQALSVPFSKRYFLGGSQSLRGWGRFQVSPLDTDGLPIGGRSVFEATTELRMPVRGPLDAVFFVDAGNVWPGERFDVSDLLWDVGGGVRYHTPVGMVRADLGWQVTPLEGLFVNGAPAERRWRVHFSLGHVF